MGYMEEQAQERERIRQQMLGGQRPSAIGQEDPNAPAPQGVQLPANAPELLQALQQFLSQALTPKGVKVDPAKPLEVPMMIPGRPPPPEPERWRGSDVDVGGAITSMFDKAKNEALQNMQRGASTRDAATRGQDRYIRSDQPPAPQAPPIPGPYGKPMPPAGSTVTGPRDYGGGTGGGVAGDVPGLPGGPSGRALTPEERKAAGGGGYEANLKFLQERGGHTSKLVDGKITDTPLTEKGSYKDLDPEMAARLAQGAKDYEAATGKKAVFGEFSRGEDVQAVYRGRYERGEGGIAARPGQSRHQHGQAGDIPRGEFRDWLDANGDKYGVHFPVKGDIVHVQMNPAYKGPALATAAPAAAPAATAAAPAAAAGSRAPGVPSELSKLVMSKEWFVANPVDDYGQKTIGYGTEARGRTSITEPEARAEMNARLQQHLNKIDATFPNLPDGVRNSVASLTFNVGEGWMDEKGNGLAAALKAGDMKTAKQQFMRYVHVHENGQKKVLQGLVNRRTDEARAFDGQQPLYTKNPDAPAGSQPEVTAAATDVAGNPLPSAESAKPATVVAEQPATATPTEAAKVAELIAPKEPTPEQVFAGDKPVPTEGQPTSEPTPEEVFGADVPVPTEGQPTAAAPSPVEPAVTPAPAVTPSQPAPAATPAAPPPAARAAPPPAPRPAPSPAPAAAPPVKQQTGVDRAHALLDMKTGDFVRKHAPEHLGKVKSFGVENTPLRELVQKPFVGSQIVDGLRPAMESKFGFKMEDFQKAITQPSPTLGKRSELGTSGATDISARAKTPMAPPGLDEGRVPLPQERPTGAPTPEGPPPAAQVTPQPPQVTPSIADALVKSVQDQGAPPIDMKPNPEALPVLPATEVAPPAPGAPGGLSLAPPGLDLAAPGAGPFQTAMGAPGSQGGAISMLGVLPQIQNSTFSTPLLDQQATQPSVGQGNLSPIPWDTLGGWGWGGGPSAGIGDFGGGGGFDFGGGAASMFSGGGGLFPMPMTWGG